MDVPGYSALLLRRTFKELAKSGALMDRAHKWWDSTDAKWSAETHSWTFPSGAKIEFGYLERETDLMQYQCFTPDHEILTERGWVRVANVEVGELAATLNPSTREMTFQPVTHTWGYDYNGDVVEVGRGKGGTAAFRVTPNHLVWASTKRNPTLRPYMAGSLPVTGRIPQWAEWRGRQKPGEISFTSDGHNGRTVSFSAENWASFLGWFIAEGSLDRQGWTIRLSQVTPQGREKIRDVLEASNLNYYDSPQEFRFSNKALFLWLRSVVGSPSYKKVIPGEVKDWPRHLLKILLRSLVDGDGTWYTRTRGVFITSSKQLADDVCEIAIKAGFRPKLADVAPHPPNSEMESKFGNRPRYRVHLVYRQSDSEIAPGNIHNVHYEGRIYCVTVPPHHTVLIRHRGRVSWIGQSAQYQYIGLDELTQFPEHHYLYMFSRLRRLGGSNVPIRMRGATNPGGPGWPWVKKRFKLHGRGLSGLAPGLDRAFVFALLEDNPHLDVETYERSLDQLSSVTHTQLRYGDFDIHMTGGRFKPYWFQPIGKEEIPEPLMRVRYWDLAASEPSELDPDPDWTAGVLVSKSNYLPERYKLKLIAEGTPITPPFYYIEDIVRVRKTSGDVEDMVFETAYRDGHDVSVWIEQERGATGKGAIQRYREEVLSGFKVRGLWLTGAKPERISALSSRAQEGRFFMVVAPWNEAFLDEAALYTGKGNLHDDQLDAAAGTLYAFQKEEYMTTTPQAESH